MVVKVKDAETKRNKASVAHTGWDKRTKTSTTTPKKVCLYSSSLQLPFQQKICKSESDRAAGKPDTPCDWASCVKERGLMRSSPTSAPAKKLKVNLTLPLEVDQTTTMYS